MSESRIIPLDWLPDPARFPMDRAVMHWTAGRDRRNSIEERDYHLMIEGDGRLYRGNFPIEANYRIQPPKYAAHVANFNGGSIGIAMCGCLVKKPLEVPGIGSSFPLNQTQWDVAVKVCAELAVHFRWAESEQRLSKVGPRIIGHCEVYPVWGVWQDGKIDPWRPMPGWPFPATATPKEIGDAFRAQVWQKVKEL